MGKLSTSLGATALTVALATSAAACSTEAATAPPPTPTSSASTASVTPTPTINATPSPPAMPAAAKANTAAGAKAFVVYYWQVVDYASTTLDTSLLEKLTSEACEACHRGIDGLKTNAKRGVTLRGGASSVQQQKVTLISNNGVQVAEDEFTLKNEDQIETLPNGNTKTYPAATVRDRMWLQWLDGRWTASQLEALK